MKKFIYILVLFALSCSKDIEQVNRTFPLLSPANNDANAGSWKPILVTAFDSYAPSAELSESDATIKQQLNDIVELQKKHD